jgi:hypothetical protein
MNHTSSHIHNLIKNNIINYENRTINENEIEIYNTWLEMIIEEPLKKFYPEEFPKSFFYFRQQLDNLTRFRYVSIVLHHNNKRYLKYIFDEFEDLQIFYKIITKNYPFLNIDINRVQYYI